MPTLDSLDGRNVAYGRLNLGLNCSLRRDGVFDSSPKSLRPSCFFGSSIQFAQCQNTVHAYPKSCRGTGVAPTVAQSLTGHCDASIVGCQWRLIWYQMNNVFDLGSVPRIFGYFPELYGKSIDLFSFPVRAALRDKDKLVL